MIKFAFYGRVSTEDAQDPEASRSWQLRRAMELITPHDGQVVAEYFDIGLSRSIPWKRRPRAADLLAALPDCDRGFDAIVIGEPQRAFYGAQFSLTFPVMTHYGVGLWVPEVGGAVDPGSEAHDLVMILFGGMSKGERARIQIRVRTAMAALAQDTTRFLGGVRLTAIASPMRARTLIRSRRRPASARTVSNQIRSRHRLWSGSTRCTPGTVSACGQSRSYSPTRAYRVLPPTTRYAIGTGIRAAGHTPQSEPSSPTRTTPAAESGTGSTRSSRSSIRTTLPPVTKRACDGATSRSGFDRPGRRIPPWSTTSCTPWSSPVSAPAPVQERGGHGSPGIRISSAACCSAAAAATACPAPSASPSARTAPGASCTAARSASSEACLRPSRSTNRAPSKHFLAERELLHTTG